MTYDDYSNIVENDYYITKANNQLATSLTHVAALAAEIELSVYQKDFDNLADLLEEIRRTIKSVN